MKILTAAGIAKLKPASIRREISDAGTTGLRLVVQPSGYKSWMVRWKRNGRQAKIFLGPLSLHDDVESTPKIGTPLTLRAARLLASQLNHERHSGVDVVADRQRLKLELAARGQATFAQAAQDFAEQHVKRNTIHWDETLRILGLEPDLSLIKRGLAERWRDRAISEITADEIFMMIEEAREKGTPGLEKRKKGPAESRARKMHRTLSKMFAWLQEKRRIAANPVEGLATPATPRARDRVLTSEEVIRFWRAADAEATFGPMLKVLLLTGQRLSEVTGIRKSEIAGEIWTIPSSRTKNKLAHDVLLAPIVRDLLPESGHDLYFTTTGTTPISGLSKVKNRIDAPMGIPKWSLHDLRRTAATGMADLGVAPHIIEAVLNHISGHKAGVAGTYNRAKYSDEKKAALKRWAAHVEGLVTGRKSKVLDMKRKVAK
jgi:integrase